jgi:hypothetical protein
MQQDQRIDVPQHQSFVRHPIHATAEEAARVSQLAARGEDPATPVILIGVVLTFVVPLATIIMVLVLGIAHFS